MNRATFIAWGTQQHFETWRKITRGLSLPKPTAQDTIDLAAAKAERDLWRMILRRHGVEESEMEWHW
jgi:hypothetical protein